MSLKINVPYTVTKVYPESTKYHLRDRYEGERFIVRSHADVLTTRRYNLSLPVNISSAGIVMESGPFRSQFKLLTYFTARLVPDEPCTCDAYPFPHRLGGGDCTMGCKHEFLQVIPDWEGNPDVPYGTRKFTTYYCPDCDYNAEQPPDGWEPDFDEPEDPR